MKSLSLKSIGDVTRFLSPTEIKHYDLKTPALEFFTDFTETQPLVIEANTSAAQTTLLMKKAHVRFKLVIDDNDQVIGAVSADDLIERRFIQKLGKGVKLDEFSITDFMTPRAELMVLEYEDVAHSTISCVVNALKHKGKQHCLVVDSEHGSIRGMFSVSDISRKLKVDIDVYDEPSFSKLADKLD